MHCGLYAIKSSLLTGPIVIKRATRRKTWSHALNPTSIRAPVPDAKRDCKRDATCGTREAVERRFRTDARSVGDEGESRTTGENHSTGRRPTETSRKRTSVKIHLKSAPTDRLSLCRALPGTRWVLQEALPDQNRGTVCLSCAKNAVQSEPDQEERRLLADLEGCRAKELATANQLSNPRKSNLYSTYRELIDALKDLRLKCEQKLITYRAYRQKIRDRGASESARSSEEGRRG